MAFRTVFLISAALVASLEVVHLDRGTKNSAEVEPANATENHTGNARKELEVVEQVLRSIINSTLLTGALVTDAKRVVSDMEDAVTATVSNSSNLTKQERQKQLASVIKELQGFQSNLSQAAIVKRRAQTERLRQLDEDLAAKQAFLNQTENILKLATVEKELIENKLKFERLLEAEAAAEMEEEKKHAHQEAVVAKLVASAQILAGNRSALLRKAAGFPAAMKSGSHPRRKAGSFLF